MAPALKDPSFSSRVCRQGPMTVAIVQNFGALPWIHSPNNVYPEGFIDTAAQYIERLSYEAKQSGWKTRQCHQLCRILPVFTKCQSLDLTECGLGDAEIQVLAEGIGNTSLTNLNLWENDIGNAGIEALAQALGSSTLTSLKVANNKFGDVGLEAFRARTRSREVAARSAIVNEALELEDLLN